MSKTEFSEVMGSSSFYGAEDFLPVVGVDLGDSYNWNQFYAWYSTSQRTYFWGSGRGCSCSYFGGEFSSISDFSNGDRDALARALDAFMHDTEAYPEPKVSDYTAAIAEVRAFLPPRSN